MKKYKQTKNLREVEEALKNRIAVKTIYTRVYLDTLGVIRWSCGEVVPKVSGRGFRIEIPRPVPEKGWRVLGSGELVAIGDRWFGNGSGCIDEDIECGVQCPQTWYARKIPEEKPKQWTGPTREITAEELPWLRDSAGIIIERKGVCEVVDCDNCAGSPEMNDGACCSVSGYASSCDSYMEDQHLAENCKRFLREHPIPVEKEPKMRRVELFREEGTEQLCYRVECVGGTWAHSSAPSVKGFAGFIYAGHEGIPRNSASMFAGKAGTLYHKATIKQIESGEMTPVYPVAFLVREGD